MLLIFSIVLVNAGVLAWGNQGHYIIGFMAQNFLTAKAKTQLDYIFSQFDGQLSSFGAWADYAKFQPEYLYTKPFHYVNVHDNPPLKCEFVEQRDCQDGNCIIGAIARYTKEAKCGQPIEQQAEALKFLVHFFGDITQPLHTSTRENGGKLSAIVFDGLRTNLHEIWDTEMVLRRIQSRRTFKRYIKYLTKFTPGLTGRPTWISNHSIYDVSAFGNSMIAIDYVLDSNQISCTSVWENYDFNTANDLSSYYYSRVATIIDIQFAKAAYRLADFLNKLFDDCPDRA